MSSKYSPHKAHVRPKVTKGLITRTLLNGDVCRVIEAPKHKFFTMTRKALIRGVKNDPCQCAVAIEAANQTGHYWELYRNVAYERVNATTVYRYRVPEKVRMIELVNDLAVGASQKLAKMEISLRAPSEATSLANFRGRQRRYKAELKNGRKAAKRHYSRSPAKALGLRASANHY